MIQPRALASNTSNLTQSKITSRSRGLCVLARSQQQQQQQRKGSKAPQQPTQASLRSVNTLTVVKPSSGSDCTCPQPAAAGATSPSALTAAVDAPWAGPLFVACGAFVCSFISLQVRFSAHLAAAGCIACMCSTAPLEPAVRRAGTLAFEHAVSACCAATNCHNPVRTFSNAKGG
jgi:hypothetical protein